MPFSIHPELRQIFHPFLETRIIQCHVKQSTVLHSIFDENYVIAGERRSVTSIHCRRNAIHEYAARLTGRDFCKREFLVGLRLVRLRLCQKGESVALGERH